MLAGDVGCKSGAQRKESQLTRPASIKLKVTGFGREATRKIEQLERRQALENWRWQRHLAPEHNVDHQNEGYLGPLI